MTARLIVVGGFLGAGKTSAILRLAQTLVENGKKVGIVTNDQSENLVDTNFLRGEGRTVVEVTRGCFCCNFDEFTLKLRSLSETDFPNIILAEPVGSCTDLIATIYKPIMNGYVQEFTLAPLSVLADPRRIKKYMSAVVAGDLNEINYLFDKQLSEADIILVNKCDLLTKEDVDEIAGFLRSAYPGTEVIPISVLTGDNLDTWFDFVLHSEAVQKPSYDIDYDIYARAEATLGWYNGFVTVKSEESIDLNDLITSLLESVRDECAVGGYEIAHIKAYAVTGLDFAKASVTSSEDAVNFNKKAEFKADSLNLILNARVEAPPADLERICSAAIRKLAEMPGVNLHDYKSDCFSPDYPKPKYRIP
jgi:Ni2+-binding GTPase involved in maturation of urease and hydrogenase